MSIRSFFSSLWPETVPQKHLSGKQRNDLHAIQFQESTRRLERATQKLKRECEDLSHVLNAARQGKRGPQKDAFKDMVRGMRREKIKRPHK